MFRRKISISPKFWTTGFWSTIRPIIYTALSWPSLRAWFFCWSIFFLASTIHPRVLIEEQTADIKGEKKSSSIHRATSIWSIYSSVLTWRDWSVGQSAVQKARTREKRCEWSDRQMDRQADRKWNVHGGELNDVFEFGRYHPAVRPSGRWKRWKGCPPPFGVTPGPRRTRACK